MMASSTTYRVWIGEEGEAGLYSLLHQVWVDEEAGYKGGAVELPELPLEAEG